MSDDFQLDARPCPHARLSASGRFCIDCFEELDPTKTRLSKADRWDVEDKAVTDGENK